MARGADRSVCPARATVLTFCLLRRICWKPPRGTANPSSLLMVLFQQITGLTFKTTATLVPSCGRAGFAPRCWALVWLSVLPERGILPPAKVLVGDNQATSQPSPAELNGSGSLIFSVGGTWCFSLHPDAEPFKYSE